MYLDMTYLRRKGTTEERPVDTEESPIPPGRQWYDTDLNKQLWWDAEEKQWIDANSDPV